MRYVVLGAGAVGGTVGGLLADSGHDVVLVARGTHAAAMQQHGLRLATPTRVLTVRVPVVADLSTFELAAGDVVFLATKTQDTAAALEALMSARMAPDVPMEQLPVVCVQNGVENERIAARRFANVYGVVVMLPAVMLEPGRIEAQGAPKSGLLDIGRWPSGVDDVAREIATALSASGFVSRAVADVMRWKHAKLLRNLGNAIEALCGHDIDEDGMKIVRSLDERMRTEAVACFAAAGIAWTSDDEWAAHRGDQVQHAQVEGRSRVGGSTWQSLARGLGTIEVDYLNGEIVMLGREYGVETPANVAVQRLANAHARSGGAPGGMTPQQVLDAVTRHEREEGRPRG